MEERRIEGRGVLQGTRSSAGKIICSIAGDGLVGAVSGVLPLSCEQGELCVTLP